MSNGNGINAERVRRADDLIDRTERWAREDERGGEPDAAAPAQADPLPATPDVLRALYGLGGEGDGDGCVELTDGAVAAMGVPEDVVEYLREADARGEGGERDDDDDTEPDGAP